MRVDSDLGPGPPVDQAGGESPKAAQSKDGKGGDKQEKKKLELEDKQRDLKLAEIELQMAQMSTRHSIEDAERAIEKAEREHVEAQQALSYFMEVDRKRQIDSMNLSVDRSEFRIENNAQDLKQMEDDYARTGDEYYAKKTGEIVVWRTKAGLDFSKRGHELTLIERTKLMEITLPKEERKLRRAVAKAERTLDRSRQKAESAKLKVQMEMIRAEAKIAKLKRDIAKLEKELKA